MVRVTSVFLGVLTVVLLVAAATACRSGSDIAPAAGADTAGGPVQFPAIDSLPRAAAEIGGYTRLGREFSTDIPHPRVEALGDQAEFLPVGSALPEDLAYACYVFNLLGAAGLQPVQFEWELAPVINPAAPQFWIGLANWDAGGWRWFAPAAAGEWTIDDIAPFIQPGTGNAYVILLAGGTAPAILNEFGFPALAPPVVGPVVMAVQPLSGWSGAIMTFTADVDCPDPYDITWDFGGGAEPGTSSDPAPAVTLGPAGIYDCSVSVSNAGGADDFDFSLQVSTPGPAVVSVSPRGGMPGAAVTFTPLYDSPNPFEVAWDFGGGAEPNTSTEPFPTVTLGAVGDYGCNVSVSNADGSDSFDFILYVRDRVFFACGRLGDEWWPEGYEDVHLTGTVELTVESDADGFFVFPNLPNGNYTATPVSANFVPDHIDFSIADGYQSELNFELWDGQLLHGIHGVIIGDNGFEMTHADVQLTGAATRFSSNGVVFSDLADGDYHVTPVEAGYIFYPPSRDLTLNQVNVFGLNFQASPVPLNTFTVNGTVRDAISGLPAAGILLELRATFNEFAVTDVNGFYEFTDVPSVPVGMWKVKPVICPAAATFSPPFGHFITDEGDTTGKDFLMTVAD